MRLYSDLTDYDGCIHQAKALTGVFDELVLLHCYWSGAFSEKHLISIRSCYYFNVYKRKNKKIILWIQDSENNIWRERAAEYAEIRLFDPSSEQAGSPWDGASVVINNDLSFYSDYVRYLILYKYGGMWFDLDVLFLRNFEPIFIKYRDDVFVYSWELQNYPNGALFGCLADNQSLANAMNFIKERGRGLGFQEANLTFDLPINFLVLPCNWFDPDWLPTPFNLGFEIFRNVDKSYDFNNFFPGSFAYHWHNQWEKNIEEKSIIRQLDNIIVEELRC